VTAGQHAAPGGGAGPAPQQPVPLDTGGRIVPTDWIDYIGHMMDAYYFAAFTEATEALLDHLGLGATYRERANCGMYTVESHLCFRASVRAGEMLSYSSQLLGSDPKRLHVFHRMTLADSGLEVATNELMFLHVDLASERVTAMPADVGRAAIDLAAEHAALPVPPAAGRRIAMKRSK
jgi:acyl-CoA thioester hydrolase